MRQSLLFPLTICIFIMILISSVSASKRVSAKTPIDRQKLCDGYTGNEEKVSSILKIGYRKDAAPFSYGTDSGEKKGYIVDICKMLADKITGNGNYQFIEVTSGSRFTDLDSGKIDLLCDSSTLTLERAACFDHTLLTFPSGPTLAHTLPVKKFQKDEIPKIGILGGPSSTIQRAQEQKISDKIKTLLKVDNFSIVPMNSYDELFESIGKKVSDDKSIDLIFADREILLEKAEQSPETALSVQDNYMGYEPYTIYMRPDRDLRYKVNAALVEIYSSPEIHKLLRKNFSRLSDTVGQLIILQRIPAGKIYDEN